MKKGLLHIYCGDGKGKTTAATGLAVRAAGSGMKVLFARFLKDENSAELEILESIPNIEVLNPDKSYGFYWTLGEDEKAALKETYRQFWNKIVSKCTEKNYEMLVMDEFMAAYQYELMERKEALEFLAGRPEGLEVVLTGRDPSEELLELADYVSEIRKIKHPFDKNIQARKGIEF